MSHVYRWDLDRTYLDTDIHSVRAMIRSALEPADNKRTIPGAPALLRSLLDHAPEASLEILSGSPVQMREVLERKLQLDGIRVDRLVLKDNLRNLRRGRFRALREQLGYKLPQLLTLRGPVAAHASETLFGDDAEIDGLIYRIYADATAGRIDPAGVASIMRVIGAYEDQIAATVRDLEALTPADTVEDIFILVERGVPLQVFDHLGGLVRPVYSWFQAALALVGRGRVAPLDLMAVARGCNLEPSGSAHALVALAVDAVRRRLVDTDAAREAFQQVPQLRPLADALQQGVRDLGGFRRPVADITTRPDYRAFIRLSAEVQAS